MPASLPAPTPGPCWTGRWWGPPLQEACSNAVTQSASPAQSSARTSSSTALIAIALSGWVAAAAPTTRRTVSVSAPSQSSWTGCGLAVKHVWVAAARSTPAAIRQSCAGPFRRAAPVSMVISASLPMACMSCAA